MPVLSKTVFHFRWMLWLATGLMAVSLLIGFWGMSQRHAGRLELTPIEQGPERFVYSGKLRSENAIFRGNDLFSVHETRIKSEQPSSILTVEWIPENIKGGVHIESKVDLAESPPIIVDFSLGIRWSKLSHWLALIFTGHLAMAYWRWFSNLKLDDRLTESESCGSIRLNCSRLQWFATCSVLVLLFLFCLGHILLPVGWIYGDTHFVLSTFVRGNFTAGAIFSDVSRFYPLAFLDLNLLLPFGDSPFAYQIERSFMFVLHVGLLFHFSAIRCGKWVAALLVISYLTTAELLRIYCEVIFPETLLTVALVVFASGYYRALVDQKKVAGIIAFFAAVLASYCKEPVFGALIVFALFQVVMGYRQLSKTAFTINILLFINGIVFLGLYYYFGYGEKNYVEVQSGGTEISSLDSIKRFFAIPWVTAMTCFTGYRVYRAVLHGDRTHVFEDGLLLAGTSYVFAFVLLRLTGAYYLVPASTFWFCALPGYFAIPFCRNSLSGNQFVRVHSSDAARYDNVVGRGRFGLLAILVLGSLSISNTIKGGDYVREARRDTLILDHALHKLTDSGFDVYFAFPPEMNGRDQITQKWRKLVVDVFLLNRKTLPIEKIIDQSLTKNLKVDEPPSIPLHQKCIVVHDPRYPTEWIDKQFQTNAKFRRIYSLPLLHGAALYGARSEMGSGTVAGTALRELGTTVPDPISPRAQNVRDIGTSRRNRSEPDIEFGKTALKQNR